MIGENEWAEVNRSRNDVTKYGNRAAATLETTDMHTAAYLLTVQYHHDTLLHQLLAQVNQALHHRRGLARSLLLRVQP
jgi:hypothetical protein